MRKVGGPVDYIKFNELNAGDVIVDNAKYVESFEGKFGINHKFMTEEMKEVVAPSAGKLNYLVNTYLTEGMKCKVVYKGKQMIESGKMKGKEAHDFDLFVEDNTPTKKVSSNTSLDDLE